MVAAREEVTMNILRSIFRFVLGALAAAAVAGGPFHAAESEAACQLNSPGNQIKHVIFIIFDNVHFRRDNPNVPSDLQQMPDLHGQAVAISYRYFLPNVSTLSSSSFKY